MTVGRRNCPTQMNQGLTWEDLASVEPQMKGFASGEEDFQIYLDLAQHMEEVEAETTSYAVCKTKTSRERLCWKMTKSGRRRARRVGPGGT
eukprot:5639912-Amphidinium_carterae.1